MLGGWSLCLGLDFDAMAADVGIIARIVMSQVARILVIAPRIFLISQPRIQNQNFAVEGKALIGIEINEMRPKY